MEFEVGMGRAESQRTEDGGRRTADRLNDAGKLGGDEELIVLGQIYRFNIWA